MSLAAAWEREFEDLPPALAEKKMCEWVRYEQLSMLEQRIFLQNMAGIEDELDEGADPVSRGTKFAGWLALVGLTLYPMLFILQFGTVTPKATVEAWLRGTLVLYACVLAIYGPLNVYVFFVFLPMLIRDKLRNLKDPMESESFPFATPMRDGAATFLAAKHRNLQISSSILRWAGHTKGNEAAEMPHLAKRAEIVGATAATRKNLSRAMDRMRLQGMINPAATARGGRGAGSVVASFGAAVNVAQHDLATTSSASPVSPAIAVLTRGAGLAPSSSLLARALTARTDDAAAEAPPSAASPSPSAWQGLARLSVRHENAGGVAPVHKDGVAPVGNATPPITLAAVTKAAEPDVDDLRRAETATVEELTQGAGGAAPTSRASRTSSLSAMLTGRIKQPASASARSMAILDPNVPALAVKTTSRWSKVSVRPADSYSPVQIGSGAGKARAGSSFALVAAQAHKKSVLDNLAKIKHNKYRRPWLTTSALYAFAVVLFLPVEAQEIVVDELVVTTVSFIQLASYLAIKWIKADLAARVTLILAVTLGPLFLRAAVRAVTRHMRRVQERRLDKTKRALGDNYDPLSGGLTKNATDWVRGLVKKCAARPAAMSTVSSVDEQAGAHAPAAPPPRLPPRRPIIDSTGIVG